MKIAQIVCAWPPYAGGIGNSAYRFSQLLADKHEIENFTPLNLRPWLKYGHGAFAPQLLWRLRKFDYIYLHYPFFGTAEIICLLKLFCRQPKLIIHYHMDVKNYNLTSYLLSWPSRLVLPKLLKQAEIITTASLDYIKSSQIKNFYSKNTNKFYEIPFGLDTEKFQPKRLNRPAENFIMAKAAAIVNYVNDQFIKKNRLNLLFVGGLDQAHYFKGLEVLLRALNLLNFKNWELTIIGEGQKRPYYEALAQKWKIDKTVKFLGQVSDADLIRAYQNADLFILPSINTNEAFGLVLTEALACGVPVIASELPGVRTVFNNHQEGLLVKPGDIEDLKAKLEFIFNNEKARQKMATAARKLAVEKYDWRIIKERLNEIFK